MTNVIRPNFDRATDEASETVDNFTPLKLIVDQEAGEAAETVAILPDTAAGEAEAETMAHAILRTLAIVRESFVGCPGSPALDS